MPLLDPRAEAMASLMAGVLLMALNSGPSVGNSTASSCWSKGSMAMMPSRAAAHCFWFRRVCGMTCNHEHALLVVMTFVSSGV